MRIDRPPIGSEMRGYSLEGIRPLGLMLGAFIGILMVP